jgi:hypothetical protein
MDRPIYAGPRKGKRSNRWRTIFLGIVIIQFILLGLYLYQRKEAPDAQPVTSIRTTPSTSPSTSPSIHKRATEPQLDSPQLQSPTSPLSNDQLQAIEQALNSGNIQQAHTLIQPLLNQSNATILDLLGQINIHRLLSSQPMEGKTFYTVKRGDYLQKIARQFNTTIALIKKMNNMKTDTIRVGARLLVFEGSFSIPSEPANSEKPPRSTFLSTTKSSNPHGRAPPTTDLLSMAIQKTY